MRKNLLEIAHDCVSLFGQLIGQFLLVVVGESRVGNND